MPDSDPIFRLLIVLPSWVGDAVMATPALTRIRRALPETFIGALVRPGIDRLLDGLAEAGERDVFDEFHLARPSRVLGLGHTAVRLRPHRYDTALLLTGSFSTALTARIAGIPRRVGYVRDARGPLLTHRLKPPRTGRRSWAVVPAVSYYWHAANALIDPAGTPAQLSAPEPDAVDRVDIGLPDGVLLSIPVSDRDEQEAARVRTDAAFDADAPLAILNPGGNNPAKRWPADRFAALADYLAEEWALTVLVNGSPAEAELCRQISGSARAGRVIALPDHGHTIGALKVFCRDARIMVTNDTGPRHIAAAVGCPLVSLFGPTDARWTSIPVRTLPGEVASETILVADPTLPVDQIANDHPDRCSIDRIALRTVIDAAGSLMARTG